MKILNLFSKPIQTQQNLVIYFAPANLFNIISMQCPLVCTLLYTILQLTRKLYTKIFGVVFSPINGHNLYMFPFISQHFWENLQNNSLDLKHKLRVILNRKGAFLGLRGLFWIQGKKSIKKLRNARISQYFTKKIVDDF